MVDLRCCGNCEHRQSWGYIDKDEYYFEETCLKVKSRESSKLCPIWKWDQATNEERIK